MARMPAAEELVAGPAARPEAVRRALEVFSDPWSFAVLQEAFFGVRRFEQIQRNLGISRNVLAKRLRHLVEHEILERALYQRRPDRYEYRLTARGREMYPIFVALQHWSERWLGEDGPRLQLVHAPCGKASRPRMTCDRCGEDIHAGDMRYELHEPAP
jgi:DNA-binding HxlR family transcriptional regulator